MSVISYFWHDVLHKPYKLARTIDQGTGKPILLIHGIAASALTWQPLVKLLDATQWRLIGFDLLGFGVSPKPQNRQYDVDEHARSIIASLSRAEKNQKFILIGHSMGCLIATHIATIRPDLVERLILYEPPLFADSPEFRSHARRRRLYFALYESLLERPGLLFKYSKLIAKIAEGRALSVGSSSWLPFEKSLQNTIMKQTAYNDLKVIKVPTDIIYGSFDFMVTRTEVKKMLRENKYVTFHLVNEMHDITTRAAKFIIKLLKQL